MKTEKQEWILVRDPSELRAGMTVKVVKSPVNGGKNAVVMLLRYEPDKFCARCLLSKHLWWTTGGYGCTTRCVPEGRMFRLDTGITDEQARDQMLLLHTPRKVGENA